MNLEKNVPLAPRTTLGVGGNASEYTEVSSVDELREACKYAKAQGSRVIVLGGGSNVLVPDAGLSALVLHLTNKEITIAEEADDEALVTVGAGALLDEFIAYAVDNALSGVENLSGIPGLVGAVPIQNVGAYGVEAKDVVHAVEVYDPHTDALRSMDNTSCLFGYRDSFFKQKEGRHLIVTSVTFKLSRKVEPKIAYKDLAARFLGEPTPSLSDIRNEVIRIRAGKFPDWHTIGTAGSFFKNPIIDEGHYKKLCTEYPGIPGFPCDGNVKIPLGWVLDKVLNLRGYRAHNVGLYENQALVLINYGGATAEEIIFFSDTIIKKIFDATGIHVEREVVTFM